MRNLLVYKGLERRGKIGPLYVHEALFLLLGCLAIFLLLSIVRYWVCLSLWWYTSTPCLFVMGILLAKLLGKQTNPTLFCSYLSFYGQEPQCLRIQQPIYEAKSSRS